MNGLWRSDVGSTEKQIIVCVGQNLRHQNLCGKCLRLLYGIKLILGDIPGVSNAGNVDLSLAARLAHDCLHPYSLCCSKACS